MNAKGDVLRNFADPTFEAIAERNRSLSAIAEMNSYYVTVSNDGEAMRLSASWVSSQFFDVLGVKPAAGRFFVPEEQQRGAAKAAVISYALWQRLFAGDEQSDRRQAAERLVVDHGGRRAAERPRVSAADRCVPRARDRGAIPELYGGQLEAPRAREAEGVTIDQARQDVSLVLRRLKAQVGDFTYTVDGTVVPLRDQIVGQIRPILLLLFGASGVLLLIACTNVVNLLVARMAAREDELAVRVALGAGRGRLIQQLLIEAALLSLLDARGVWRSRSAA